MSRLLFLCTVALVFALLVATIATEPVVSCPSDLGTPGVVSSTVTAMNDQRVVRSSDFRFDRALGTLRHAFSWTLEGGSRWC